MPYPHNTEYERLQCDGVPALNDKLASGEMQNTLDVGIPSPMVSDFDIYPDRILVQILDQSTDYSTPYLYSYVQVIDSGDGVTFIPVEGGMASNEGAYDLAEINKNGTVPIGTITWAWSTSGDPADYGPNSGWQFDYSQVGFWAQITAQDSTTHACAWTSQNFAGDGTFMPGSLSGTTTTNPAYPADLDVCVQIPCYVWLRPGYLDNETGNQEYEFEGRPSWTLIGQASEDIDAADGTTVVDGEVAIYTILDGVLTASLDSDSNPLTVDAYNISTDAITSGDWLALYYDPFSENYFCTASQAGVDGSGTEYYLARWYPDGSTLDAGSVTDGKFTVPLRFTSGNANVVDLTESVMMLNMETEDSSTSFSILQAFSQQTYPLVADWAVRCSITGDFIAETISDQLPGVWWDLGQIGVGAEGGARFQIGVEGGNETSGPTLLDQILLSIDPVGVYPAGVVGNYLLITQGLTGETPYGMNLITLGDTNVQCQLVTDPQNVDQAALCYWELIYDDGANTATFEVLNVAAAGSLEMVADPGGSYYVADGNDGINATGGLYNNMQFYGGILINLGSGTGGAPLVGGAGLVDYYTLWTGSTPGAATTVLGTGSVTEGVISGATAPNYGNPVDFLNGVIQLETGTADYYSQESIIDVEGLEVWCLTLYGDGSSVPYGGSFGVLIDASGGPFNGYTGLSLVNGGNSGDLYGGGGNRLDVALYGGGTSILQLINTFASDSPGFKATVPVAGSSYLSIDGNAGVVGPVTVSPVTSITVVGGIITAIS